MTPGSIEVAITGHSKLSQSDIILRNLFLSAQVGGQLRKADHLTVSAGAWVLDCPTTTLNSVAPSPG